MRTVRLGETRGWVKVERSDRPHALRVQVSTSLARVLPALLARLRCLFDLDARPDLIAEQLSARPVLARAISVLPGLRVPGCVDGFEMAVRAILGQRISVPAATTLAGRLAAAFGEPVETPFPCLNRLGPTPDATGPGRAGGADLAGHRRAAGTGDPRAGPGRGRSAHRARAGGRSRPHDRAAQAASRASATGPRITSPCAALRWPDAFPAADLGLLRASGGHCRQASWRGGPSRWRPWRSYAAMILWNSGIPLPPLELPIHGQDHVLPATFQPAR